MKQFEDIALTSHEKAAVRIALIQHILKTPVRIGIIARLREQRSFVTYKMIIKDMAIALIVILLAGGGTSLAAENALPGDLLYPIKISINEEARAALAVSTEAKAQWETKRAERRIAEAQALLASNTLTVENEADLETKFEAHADKAVNLAARLTEKNNSRAAARVAAALETGLKVQGEALIKAADVALESKDLVTSLIQKIELRAEHAALTRVEAETKADAEASIKANTNVRTGAEGKRTAAENKIAEVRSFIDRAQVTAEANARTEAEAHLALAHQLVIEGTSKLEADAYADASLLFTKAHETAQEAQLLIIKGIDARTDINASTNAEVKTGNTTNIKTNGNLELNLGL